MYIYIPLGSKGYFKNGLTRKVYIHQFPNSLWQSCLITLSSHSESREKNNIPGTETAHKKRAAHFS